MNINLMLDFETLGQTEDCVVLSLGSVVFNREEIISDHYCTFQIQEQIDKGRKISADTLSWWLGQENEALRVIQTAHKSGFTQEEFMSSWGNWLGHPNHGSMERLRVWSNGANFDIPIIENLIKSYGAKVPWRFWNSRCYRTIKSMHNIELGIQRDGVKHNALDDAKYQAKCLMQYLHANPEQDR